MKTKRGVRSMFDLHFYGSHPVFDSTICNFRETFKNKVNLPTENRQKPDQYKIFKKYFN